MARMPRVGPGWPGSPPQDAQPPTNSDTLFASTTNLADLVSVLNSTNYLSLFELKHSLSRDQATLRACVRFLVCILFALLEATYGHLYPAL